jgi:hypothetical protein
MSGRIRKRRIRPYAHRAACLHSQVSELLRIEKQALDTQAQLEAMTKERDKGESMSMSMR